MKKMEQIWRVVRLFGISFGHAAWIGALGLDWPDQTALLGVLVGATEGAYRAVFPAGNARLIHSIAEMIATATAANRQEIAQAAANAQNGVSTPPVDSSALETK